MQRNKYSGLLYIALVCLLFIPYDNLIPIPGIGHVLDTQRVFLLIFVGLGFFVTGGMVRKKIRFVYSLQLIFIIAILLQFYFNTKSLGGYELLVLLQVITLMIFIIQLYFIISEYYELAYKTFLYSAILLVIYQLYQFVMFSFGFYSLVAIFNDPKIVEASSFIRIIGASLGPAGFMAESGHAALFIGPLFMILTVANYYNHFISTTFLRSFLLFGLLMTLSGSSVIQIIFIFLTTFIIDYNKVCNSNKPLSAFVVKYFIAMVLFFFAVLLLYKYYSAFIELVVDKIISFINFESMRMEGARANLALFSKHMLWGIGFGKFRETGIESNMFLPTLLLEQGLIGGSIFIILFLFPIIYRFYNSTFKLYIMPFMAMFTNLFFAYGTYRWPLIWIIYTLTLYNLSLKDYSTSFATSIPGFRPYMRLKHTG